MQKLYVAVESLSRFTRYSLISIEMVRHLQSLGIGVMIEKENVDTTRPCSEMMLPFLSAFAFKRRLR